AQIEAMRPRIEAGLDRHALQAAMPPGAARNALDCAFWDLEAKCSGRPAHELAGIAAPAPVVTAFTISLAAPRDMAMAARKASNRSLLKVKLGADGDGERIAAVRSAAPDAVLIVDANEGWREANLAANLAACARAGVKLIEQPLPAGDDQVLAKIEKTGGLTEALAMVAAAQQHKFTIMVGCMVATSLAMAPAMLLAQKADFV